MEKEEVAAGSNNDRILEILGRGHPRSSLVSSATLTVTCLFYVYTVGTFLQVRIYPLIDRVTHYITFDLYIVNEYADHVIIGALLVLWVASSIRRTRASLAAVGAFAAIFAAAAVVNIDQALDAIALSALPAMVGLLLYSRYSKQDLLKNSSSNNNNVNSKGGRSSSVLWINYLAIVGIAIGIISFAIAASTVATTTNTEGYPIERNYAYGVFLLFSSASPILLLLLITSFPVKLIIDYFVTRVRKAQGGLDTGREIAITARAKVVYLALFMLLSIIMGIVPHLGTVNPEGRDVGVDTHYYVDWVGALNNSTSTSDFLYQAFVQQRGGDRPVSLIFIHVFQQVTGANNGDDDLSAVVEATPLILGPALVLAVYFLTRELTSSGNVAPLLAAFLTAISFHTLIGLYAGFYANWLALIVGYLSFVFLFRFLKKGGGVNIALFFGLLTLTLFAHVYTWSILALATGVFLIAAMLRLQSYYARRNAGLLLVAVFITAGIDLARVSVTGSSGGIEEDLSLAEQLVGPEQFALRWNNLTYTTTTFVGGIFANFIILGLGIYWLVGAKMKEPANAFLIVFLSIGILPFLVGEWVIQTRVFYNIPFQIPAAIALFQIIKSNQIRNSSTSGTASNDNNGAGLLRTVPVYIWLVTMALIAVSNFYLIAPTGS